MLYKSFFLSGANRFIFSLIASLPFCLGADLYVSPTGTAKNTGASISSPLDIVTALSGLRMSGGGTVWLRGGTYVGAFTSYLAGTATAPITVRSYPGEWAVLADNRALADMGTLNVYGTYTTYRDFEVTNTATQRLISSSTTTGPRFRPMGISVNRPNNKFINLRIHDTGHGIGVWSPAQQTEVYGNLIYNCGSKGATNIHGHGIYVQSDVGTKLIRDNVIFNLFGWGVHAYPDPGGIKDIRVEGNIVFQSGILGDGTRMLNNILVSGYPPFAASKIAVVNNMTYQPATQAYTGNASDSGVCLGCTYLMNHQDLVMTNNYVGGSLPPAIIAGWQSATVTGNTFVGRSGVFALYGPPSPTQALVYNWNNNNYLSTVDAFAIQGKIMTFSAWKQASQLDTNTVFSLTPTGKKVIVRPNLYQTGRGHIAAYDWTKSGSVQADLTSIVRVGAGFEVRNLQNPTAAPVLKGTYAGGLVTLPMTGAPAPVAPFGWTAAPATGAEFNAFLVTQTTP